MYRFAREKGHPDEIYLNVLQLVNLFISKTLFQLFEHFLIKIFVIFCQVQLCGITSPQHIIHDFNRLSTLHRSPVNNFTFGSR